MKQIFTDDNKIYINKLKQLSITELTLQSRKALKLILVAARAHGLGSCWVAGDKKPYAERIRKMVGAPEGYKVISLLAIGPTAEETHAEKRPLSDVLHWEKF